MLRNTTYVILCPRFVQFCPFLFLYFNFEAFFVFCLFLLIFLILITQDGTKRGMNNPYIGLVEIDVNVQTSHHPQLGLCTMEPTALAHFNNRMELPHSWSDVSQSKRTGPIRLLSFHRYVIRTSLCIIITLNRYMILCLYAHPCS